MKNTLLYSYFKLLTVALLFVGQFAVGQTTNVFTYAGGGSAPTGWTFTNNVTLEPIDKGAYWLLEPGSAGDLIITNAIDLSAYASAEVKINIATFGSGANNGIKAEISYDGVNYTETKTTTVVSSTTYVTKTIALASVSSQVRIRLSVNAASGKGIRMQQLLLNGIGVGNAAPIVTGGSVSGSYGSAITPYQIMASGTPTSYAVATGTLPAGLSLNTTTGFITGTPTVVGSSSVTVTATNANGTSPAATLNFAIAPKGVTISGLTGSNKIYDGSLSATVSGTPTLNGVLPADISNVTISGAASYAFSNPNVGVAKPIVVTGITLSGSAVGNYTLTQPSDLTASITAKTVTVTEVAALNKVYDGTFVATVSGGTLTGLIASDAANVSVSTVGTFATANVGAGIAVTVSLIGSASANYALTQPTVTADITKANQTITFNAIPGLNQASSPVNLNTFATASSGLALTYVSSNPLVVSISGNTLTIVGLGTATINASQAGDNNYNTAANASQVVTVSSVPVVIAQFDFSTGSMPSAAVITVKNTNLNVSNFALSTGSLVSSTSGSEFPNEPMVEGQGGGWTSTTQAGAKNFNFTVNANAGYEIEVTSIQFNALATAAGPSAFSFDLATGMASYTVNAPSTSLVSVNETVIGLTNLTTVPVLLQGWLNGSRSSSGSGIFRIDDVILKGYVTCIKPTAFAVTGVENACGTTAVITLSDSEIDMSYQLLLDGVNLGAAIPGTGDLLDFGIQSTSGTYTIIATNIHCVASTTMVGNVILDSAGTTTWNGTSWDNGAPTDSMSAIINSNYSEVANINACSLLVNNSAVVMIPTGNSVTLSGALIVETGSSFTLSNNANLIQNGILNLNEGAITVQRNSSALMRQDYTLWSSPTRGPQTLLNFSPATLENRFYTYNTTTNQYNAVLNATNSTSPATTSFDLAKGYLIRVPNTHPSTPTIWEGNFQGIPNSGNISYTLENEGEGKRFNAIGNPYPSPISAIAFIDNATNAANTTSTLYFWRKTNDSTKPSYYTWTAAGLTNAANEPIDDSLEQTIQTGQGFFVEGTGAGTALEFNNDMRVDNHSNQFFKTNNVIERNRIWLSASSTDGMFTQTLLAYMTGATDDLDRADGKYMNDGPIALTSIINDTPYAIQARSLPFQATDLVPLQFTAKDAGTYTIALDHVDGLFDGSQAVFLKDIQTGLLTNLSKGNYTFNAPAGVSSGRFEIVYENDIALGTGETLQDELLMYRDGDNVIVRSNSAKLSDVKLYDASGRLVYENNPNAKEVVIDATTLTSGMYILKLNEGGKIVTKKLIK